MTPSTRSGRSVAQICAGQYMLYMTGQPHLGITQVPACFCIFWVLSCGILLCNKNLDSILSLIAGHEAEVQRSRPLCAINKRPRPRRSAQQRLVWLR